MCVNFWTHLYKYNWGIGKECHCIDKCYYFKIIQSFKNISDQLFLLIFLNLKVLTYETLRKCPRCQPKK